MNSYTLHITLYDLFFFGMIFIGLNFALLLAFSKGVNRAANRFLALALVVMILWMMRILAIDVHLQSYLPRWDWMSMQFLLALGPLIYFYVLKITRPEHKFCWKDILHFSPLLLEQIVLALEIKESSLTGVDTYSTHIFIQINPVLQLLIFISLITYLYHSHKLIENFYRRLQPVLMDRSRLEFRWLRRLLAATALLWLLWITYVAIDYFGYRGQSGLHAYYPFYIFFVAIIIWTAAAAFLKPRAAFLALPTHVTKPSISIELRQKGTWLKKTVAENTYYLDPELSLNSLAEKLGLSAHELSRIINTALKKSFNDFINEYRVAEFIKRMQDTAYDGITLLGIAFDSGFNSKSTFNLIFKKITGKTPAEYKAYPQKEFLTYSLGRHPQYAAVISNQKLNHNFMFRNYLKVSLRFLLKNRFFSLINIAGLATGTLCCLYILFYVMNQYSYDKHHRDSKNIYRVTTSLGHTGDIAKNMATASPPIAPALKNDFPEVVQYTRVVPTLGIKEHLISYKESAFYEREAIMVDSTFFKMFTYHFTNGSPENALTETSSIVLKKTVADKLFGTTDPIGKIITMDDGDGKNIFKVTGVVDESAGKSQILANMFIRLNKNGYGAGILANNSWAGNNFTNTFVKLRPDANVNALEKKLPAFLNKYGADQLKSSGMNKTLHLQPLTSIHTTSGYEAEGGKIVSSSFLWLLILIAILIQVIACINFMNLSTARASKRAKEVGVRKVIGAGKYDLVTQFLGESFLLSFIGIVIALPLLIIALPYLNQITQADIRLSLFNDYRLWLALGGLTIVTGLAAGSYPAFYMSAFMAIKVIKGNFTSHISTQVLRRSLVVFQFVISIVLITGVIVIYSQLNYIKNQDLGFTKDQQIILTFHTDDTRKKMEALATDLQQLAEVRSISRASNTFGAGSYYDWGVYLSGMNPADAVDQQNLFTDERFVKAMGIKMIGGRALMQGDSGKVLINESLARRLRLDPGKAMGTMLFSEGDRKFQVAGVVKDFNYKSLHDVIAPFMIVYAPKAGEVNNLIINTNTKNYSSFLASVGQVWHKVLPQTPFDYTFMNDRMQSAYENDMVLSRIINSFTMVAILISCLGLFGLSAFSAEQRNKEIGIRKVLGASVSGIVGLLSKDFMRLVVIAFLIAAPVAWWAMHQWLQGFVYKVSLSWWMFLSAAAAAILIALLTISFQAIKAAIANPVRSLRSE
ncbi:MAG: ABC transporter permease [Bacteroidota bacterium]